MTEVPDWGEIFREARGTQFVGAAQPLRAVGPSYQAGVFAPPSSHYGAPVYAPEDFDKIRRSLMLMQPNAQEAIMVAAEIKVIIAALGIAAAVALAAPGILAHLTKEVGK